MAALRLSQARRERLIDLALVVLVLWFTLAQFGSRGFGEYEDVATDPDGLGFALILLESVALLWRRRAPREVLALTIAVSIAVVSLGYGVHLPIAPAVALYTLAALPDRGRIAPTIAAATASYAAIVGIEIARLGFSPEEYAFPAVVWIGAWLIGDRRRTTRQRAAEARERREREQRLTVAEERTRIARELHDSAGHAINTILVQAGAARVLRERDPERSQAAVEAIEELARETAEDIDRIVGSLREDGHAELAPLPGIEGIATLVEHQRAAGHDVALRIGERPDRTVPPAVDRAAYRIAQEALTNAVRHGTGSAELAIDHRADALELTVSNPIAGLTATRAGGGRGIVGMRERASLVGGALEAGGEGGRFRVRAVLPYDRPRE